MPMVAWYMLSKESYMKRVIREVLPTLVRMCLGQLSATSSRDRRAQRQPQGKEGLPLCSPKNTSLGGVSKQGRRRAWRGERGGGGGHWAWFT